jgi:hypothetical protein
MSGAFRTVASSTGILRCALGLFSPCWWFFTATAASVFFDAPYWAK